MSPLLSKLNVLYYSRHLSNIRYDSKQVLKNWYCILKENTLPADQATHISHPHLLKVSELQPGVHLDEFKSRREKFKEEILKTKPKEENNIVVVSSNSQLYMSEKIPYRYRQNTDFLYFTGCTEAGATLVISTNRYGQQKEILFLKGKDEQQEIWDGPRLAVNEMTADTFGVDQTCYVNEFESFIESYLQDHKNTKIWYDSEMPSNIKNKIEKYKKFNFSYSPRKIIHNLRVIKSDAEINLMTQACDIGSEAIVSTIAAESGCKDNEWIEESRIAARIDYECRIRGAQYLAYPPVVAGGMRGNFIHYISNNQRVYPNQLILMDAGCEYFGYNSDITRVWPASGTFSPIQTELYEALLEVQTCLIETLNERPSIDQLYVYMCQLIGKALKRLKFLPESASAADVFKAVRKICPHHVSHFLGMDIHDTNTVAHNIPVKPGMILTIEPGIYISPLNEMAPEEFRGLAMRIEDDILITESGPLVLTEKCPKTIPELEKIIKSVPFQM